jgi:hypothetical protein
MLLSHPLLSYWWLQWYPTLLDQPHTWVLLCALRYWKKLWKKSSPYHHEVPKDLMPSILQLGMNCSSDEAALTAAQLLDQSIKIPTEESSTVNAGLLRRLLVTAAARRHVLAFLHMIAQPDILQQVDAATLQRVLEHLMAGVETTCIDVLLSKLDPAAVQQLSTEAIAQILQAAVDADSAAVAELVCKLPAAAGLGADSVARLLERAWKQDRFLCAAHLLDFLPAAQHLSASMVAQLAEITIERHNVTYTSRLLSLPAAQELTVDMLVQLIHAAIQESGHIYVWRLYCMPAAFQLSSSMVVTLMLTALEQGWCAVGHVSNLIQMPGAAHIGDEEAEQLIQAAEDHMNSHARVALCRLPAVGKVMGARMRAIKVRRKLWDLQPQPWLAGLPESKVPLPV